MNPLRIEGKGVQDGLSSGCGSSLFGIGMIQHDQNLISSPLVCFSYDKHGKHPANTIKKKNSLAVTILGTHSNNVWLIGRYAV